MDTFPDTCTPDRVGLSLVGMLSDQEGVPIGGTGAFDGGTPVMDTRPFSPEINSVHGE